MKSFEKKRRNSTSSSPMELNDGLKMQKVELKGRILRLLLHLSFGAGLRNRR